MTGCRVGAKNTLDKNYLYLAERLGAVVLAETEVMRSGRSRSLPSGGRAARSIRKREHVFYATRVV